MNEGRYLITLPCALNGQQIGKQHDQHLTCAQLADSYQQSEMRK